MREAHAGPEDAYQRALDLLYIAIKAIKPEATTKNIAERWLRAEEMGLAERPNDAAAVLMLWATA